MPGERDVDVKRGFMVVKDLEFGFFLLALMLLPNPPLLLALQLIIEEEKSLLVCLWSTNDSEHALASLVVWCLCNRDLGAREAPDLGDFGATTTDDAANHIGRDGNILS